jgi:hypothetical protein
VACTDDSCDETGDVVLNTPNDAQCDNGAFCDGVETCDLVNDCQAGTPPVIDDGVACTDDSCDETGDVVLNTPNDAQCDNGDTPNDTLCDNGEFCDGVETCDLVNDCQAGTPPVIDDGVGCTDDSCDETGDVVLNTPNDAQCDNGEFCDGVETCDLVNDCQAGTPPVIDDGVGCTDDSCDETGDVVVNTPNDTLCDNGEFCDGVETCDLVNDCQAGIAPDCNDNLSCTIDTCNEANDECMNIPENPEEEICDNLDNDCDGLTDEDLIRQTTCGVGECAENTGIETCTSGVWGDDTCDPFDGAADETCDDLDNDCNGIINDGVSYSFVDVPPDHWAEEYISAIACSGISTGYSDNTYRPQEMINRAQMAVFIIRTLEGDPPDGYCGNTYPFTDVSYNHWACGHIKRLEELAISLGFADGSYKPSSLVDRAQMAVYVVRALEGDPADDYCGGADPFTDVASSHWACAHIKRLSELGISGGYLDGTYRPTSVVNRAQMAVFVARAFLGL